MKLKTRTQFPANVAVTAPLTLSKTGISYTFGLNPSLGAVGPTGPGYGGTSTTSLAIGTGSKSFVTQSGYAYQAGNYVRASSAADGTNYMEGTITSYIGTSMVLNITKVGGSGTKTDWTFSLAGTPGANGAGSGDMLAAQNLADVSNKKTAKDNISIHGSNVASASTIDLEAATGDLVDVTGTTAITAITLNDGHERTVRFTGILTLTNGASLVLPGGANITTAAGDFAIFRGYAAGVVRCVSYHPISGPTIDTITGMAANVATFLKTPSSANLASALTDETGTGANVFATSPTIATPIITGRVPTSSTVTISNASPGVITWTSHGLPAFTPVFFETTGALPTGLTAAVKPTGGAFSANTYKQNPTLYYVVPGATLQTNSFTVATSLANALAGTSVNTSSAGSGTHTACANAMAPTGTVGEYIYKIVEAGDLFSITSASLGVAYNTISLTAGIWEVGGSTFIWGNGGATAWTHMHASIVYGFTTIASAPFNGTNALHANSNSSNGWGFAHNPKQIFLTSTTTINATITTDFTGGSGYAYGELWGRRIL